MFGNRVFQTTLMICLMSTNAMNRFLHSQNVLEVRDTQPEQRSDDQSPGRSPGDDFVNDGDGAALEPLMSVQTASVESKPAKRNPVNSSIADRLRTRAEHQNMHASKTTTFDYDDDGVDVSNDDSIEEDDGDDSSLKLSADDAGMEANAVDNDEDDAQALEESTDEGSETGPTPIEEDAEPERGDLMSAEEEAVEDAGAELNSEETEDEMGSSIETNRTPPIKRQRHLHLVTKATGQGETVQELEDKLKELEIRFEAPFEIRFDSTMAMRQSTDDANSSASPQQHVEAAREGSKHPERLKASHQSRRGVGVNVTERKIHLESKSSAAPPHQPNTSRRHLAAHRVSLEPKPNLNASHPSRRGAGVNATQRNIHLESKSSAPPHQPTTSRRHLAAHRDSLEPKPDLNHPTVGKGRTAPTTDALAAKLQELEFVFHGAETDEDNAASATDSDTKSKSHRDEHSNPHASDLVRSVTGIETEPVAHLDEDIVASINSEATNDAESLQSDALDDMHADSLDSTSPDRSGMEAKGSADASSETVDAASEVDGIDEAARINLQGDVEAAIASAEAETTVSLSQIEELMGPSQS